MKHSQIVWAVTLKETEFRVPRKRILFVATTRERAEEAQDKFGAGEHIRVQAYKMIEAK